MGIVSAARKLARSSIRVLGGESRLDAKTSPLVKSALRHLFFGYRAAVLSGGPLPSLRDAGLRIFSQFDEDGLILYLLAAAGIAKRRFIDIGAADALTGSNCANLAFNLGFHGLFIDGKPERIKRGRRVYERHPDTSFYPPVFRSAFVTRDNINYLIEESGFSGEVDVVSIDIDGNDYWIWEAVEVVQPRIVIVEARPELGRGPRVVPYEENLVWTPERGQYLGASPAAFVSLGTRRGYRLVGANRFGFNMLFLRNDLAPDAVPTIAVEELFDYERVDETLAKFDTIKDRQFVEV